MANRRKLPDRDTLHQLFVVEQLPTRAIAERYDVTYHAVRDALRRHSIVTPLTQRYLTQDKIAHIKRLFDAGLPQTVIADKLGITQSTVSYYIRQRSWTRPPLRSRKPKGE